MRREKAPGLWRWQKDTWDLWLQITAGDWHLCVSVGDAIDGQSKKDNGLGLITTDIDEQCDMFRAAIRHINTARGWRMVFGTGYHVCSDGMQAEKRIASVIGAKIAPRDRFSVNGYQFEVKHKSGGSQAVSGGDATLRNAMAWENKRATRQKRPPANAIVRGHNHRWRYVEDADMCAVGLPCLAGSTQFGALNCEAVIDWGVAWCCVEDDGTAYWHKRTWPLEKWLPKCEDCS